MDNMVEVFKEEVYELFENIDSSIIDLEKDPNNKELINIIFRAFHTIKGAASMYGFENISEFTHDVETILDNVKRNKIKISQKLVDLILNSVEIIRQMVNKESYDHSIVSKISSDFKNIILQHKNKTEENNITKTKYKITFIPSKDTMKKGNKITNLIKELKEFGKCEVIAITDNIPDIFTINCVECYTSWEIMLETDKPVKDIKDVFIFVEYDSEIRIEILDNEQNNQNDELISESVESKKSNLSIRVATGKLDTLVNLVGELVVIQERLKLNANLSLNADFIEISEEIERITDELRDNTLNIRMVPIGVLFTKFKKLVRELSIEVGKNVVLQTKGASTELDKTLIEKISDPLIHIIRNCIDHGIEKPEIREKLGKNKEGTITINAYHIGADVIIQVKDDGSGIDQEKIKKKAIESGIIDTNDELSKQEILNIIFQPSFSTAEKITSLSGRGVGMDIVNKDIKNINGKVEISSKKNIGTTFTIKIPLTLAIINGLLVNVKNQKFVIPLTVVDECIEINNDNDNNYSKGWDIINVRDHLIPYINLRKWCEIDEKEPELQQIVITKIDNEKIGLVVDNIIDEHQIVIKSLGKLFQDTNYFSGATILGDGSLALIFDIYQLIQWHKNEQEKNKYISNLK